MTRFKSYLEIIITVALTASLGDAASFAAQEKAANKTQSEKTVPNVAVDSSDDVPRFEYDPTWPKQLPNQWGMGNVAGLAVDAKDHIWIIQRPLTLTLGMDYAATQPPSAECCRPAPSIIEFDLAGQVVQGFGGPDPKNPKGKRAAEGYEWPREHGVFVDYRGNVWTGSDEPGSATVTKLTHDGKFIKQKGKFGQLNGDADTENFGQPAGISVDPKTNEAYIADGYHNNRVIVIDADTLAFKRMWGAYGHAPVDPPRTENRSTYKYNPDAPLSQHFSNPVHCVHLSNDDLVYVCDRVNDRIQVFKKDGTFVTEVLVAPRTLGYGSVHDIAFSPDHKQRFLYVADGANGKVWILRRADLKIIGSFGHRGHGGGELTIAHALGADSKGNLYVADTIGGDRVQKFKYMGLTKAGTNPY